MTLGERLRVRSQATLIGGVILLLVLVAVVLPLILQLNQAAFNIEQGVKLAAQVKLRATKEKVLVSFFYNQTAAAIFINNTGTVKVVIEKVIILNRTSGEPVSSPLICGTTAPCGLIDVANANDNPLVSNAIPLFDGCYVGILKGGNPANLECLDNTGRVAVLEPGDVLYISINPAIVPLLNNTAIYAESAYGVIHPVVTPPPMPGKGGAGGLPIPPSAIPRGLYTPISGFILWGYDDLTNYTYAMQEHPPFRVSTLGPNPGIDVTLAPWYTEPDTSYEQRLYCGGVPFASAGVALNHIHHLATYNVTFTVQETSYLYIYADGALGPGWYAIELDPGHVYTIVGYVGAIGLMSPKYSGIRRLLGSGCPYDTQAMLVLDGWAWDILEDGKSILQDNYLKPVSWSYPESQQQLLQAGVIIKTDVDNNNVTEETLRTFKPNSVWDALDADGSGLDYSSGTIYTTEVSSSYGYSDDVALYNITVLRDITGVDAIQVSVKVTMSYSMLISGMGDDTPDPTAYLIKPIVMVALLKYDEATNRWKIVDIVTREFTFEMPKTFWINVLFPVNRTGIYRIALYLEDPYGLINIGVNQLHGWCVETNLLGRCIATADILPTLEVQLSVEHIAVQYYVYNPLLRQIPVVYLVNITGVPYWPSGITTPYGTFGYLNETYLQSYWSWLLDFLHRNGIYPIIIRDWKTFKALLGTPEAPVHAIVIFLHGPVLPYESGLTLYDAYTQKWVTIYDPTQLAEWLANMTIARGWIVVFPYGPPLSFVWDTANNNWYNIYTYINGALLAKMVTRLLNQTQQVDVSYIFVYTGGFTYNGAGGQYSLDNYTVSIQQLGITALARTRLWWAPRIFTGNYSVVSRSTLFYQYAQGLWYNDTPPAGLTWSSLGVPPGGWAGGAVILPSGRGAAVFVAAPRPGVVAPVRLAALDLAAALYAWMEVTS